MACFCQAAFLWSVNIFAQGNEAIRYLEFAVQMLDNKDQAIHNYLLSLYAKLKPEELMKYLNFQGQVWYTFADAFSKLPRGRICDWHICHLTSTGWVTVLMITFAVIEGGELHNVICKSVVDWK